MSEIVGRVVEDLKDEAEPYRRMVMETIDKVVSALGAADIDARLEELLVDGILYAFQEQVRRPGLRGRASCCRCSVVLNSCGGVQPSVGWKASFSRFQQIVTVCAQSWCGACWCSATVLVGLAYCTTAGFGCALSFNLSWS